MILSTLTLAAVLSIPPLPPAAQAPADSFEELARRVKPGETVWVTDASGSERKVRLIDLSPAHLTLERGRSRFDVTSADVSRVRATHNDRKWNGALIGAASALVPAFVYCGKAYESGESCGENVGDLILVAAVGAGIGALIDAAIKGRRVVYERRRGR